MNRVIFLFLVLIYCTGVAGQLHPGYIPAKSPITLVYQITDTEAGKLYRDKQKSLSEKILHHCVDTLRGICDVLPDSYLDGHYLLVTAQGNHLQFRLASIVPFEHRMLNNQKDMAMVVFDRKTGKPITDARVKVGNKHLRFDRQTQSYRRKKTDKQGVLAIEVEGMTTYYTVNRKYNLNWWKRTKSGLWNAPVVKYISRPVIFVASIPMDTYRSIRYTHPVGSIYGVQKPFSDIYRSISWGYPVGWIEGITNAFNRNDDDNNDNHGFMVFSKPKYRPGDTIRFKAYVADRKGQPVKDSLSVFLHAEKSHKIGTINPYRPGFYTMDFVPKPQYGMKLDKRYRLYLTNGRTGQWGSFYYEDYELKSVQYHLRADKEEYLSHEEVTFYAKAVDENNMPAMDARVSLTLITSRIDNFNGQLVRVPNRLWNKEVTLDPVGETKIVVPDSIWPDASLGVQLIALFNNSDNQADRKDVQFTLKNTTERIVITQHADSLYFQYENHGKLCGGIQANIERGLLDDTLILLPTRIKIHPLVETYKATLKSRLYDGQPLPMSGNPKRFEQTMLRAGMYQQPLPHAVFTPSADNSRVACTMNRSRDSVFITVDNPLGLPLSYTVYKGNREQQRGTGTLAIYKAKASKKDYFLSVQYIWGGNEHQLEYRLAYDATQLKLNTSLPTIVYPGQTVKINIVATDVDGNPMPNVDLTAWSYTTKFGQQSMPVLPSYQKPPSNRKPFNAFSSTKRPDVSGSRELDYPQWREPLKLDSMELYHFAYPEKAIYRYLLPSADEQTYIAPYLVHDGKLLPVQILYIDDRPIYFNRTTTDAPYVFPVLDGIHTIRLRTNDCEVKARVEVSRGYKTIISIDPYQWDRKIVADDGYTSWGSINKKKSKYMPNELYLIRSYLMPVRYQPNNQFAWLQRGNTYEVLTPEKNQYGYGYRHPFIAGPIGGASVTLWEEGKEVITFNRDGYEWFEYEPSPGILKMRTVPFRTTFDYSPPRFGWKTLPYSKHYVDSVSHIWNFDRVRSKIRYVNTTKSQTKGQLRLETVLNDSLKNNGWCWVLYDYTWEETQFYSLNERVFTSNTNGPHALFLLMADKTFYVQDSILFEPEVTNMLRLPVNNMRHSSLPIDSCVQFRQLLKDIFYRSGMDVNIPPKPKIYEAPIVYNPEYVNGIEICGMITDETGEAIPGVSVVVEGTTVGVVTNMDGRYCIRVPEGYRTLTYSFIGYVTEKRTPLQGGYADVVLTENVQALEEVVVVGYGVQRRSSVVGSVSSMDMSMALSGCVAGVSTSAKAPDILIRGIGSFDAGSQPLYVVDGIIVTDISHISPGSITSMNVLKDATATALYGSRAANGVVAITTGKPAVTDAQDIMKQMLEDEAYQTGLASAKGLRTNFSDEAFWQPSLTTDQTGLASFKTTFPDDVTKWNLRFVGMLPGKASAGSETQVRSFKPLMGQLAVPRFMVEGDTANIIGKVMNYTSDTVHLHTSFAINGISKIDKPVSIRHSLIDTLAVVAPICQIVKNELLTGLEKTIDPDKSDSIAVRYQLTRDDGYQDGEERHIPIIKRGTTESTGQFHVLDTDTTLTLAFDNTNGPVTLSMESSSLDIMMKETRRLRDYQHLCNEQTASRLKALLLERKAYQLQGKDYPYDKHIRSLINRLVKGRNAQGLWGWFGNNSQETWISAHAAEALLQTRDDGFTVDMDFEQFTNQLILTFDKSDDIDRIRLLKMLTRINPESNYQAMFDKINTGKIIYHTDMLRWMELSLHFGEKPDIEQVIYRKQTDKLGNIHWSEPNKGQWRYNDISVTLAAYRLLQASGKYDRTLLKIRNYLFTQRDHYGWRNTYESADILTTIMPDILASGDSLGNPRVRISGDYTATIDSFPKHIILQGKESVIIEKKGSFPVFVTAWQEIYLSDPAPASEGFHVETKFAVKDGISQTSIPTTRLIAGKTATLEITISSDVPSEYVMVEIPIPAGCSYQSKPQSWYWMYGETHREYFRDRVCIYLRNLDKGNRTFTVELMPRYTGVYHVNPAKVERMYMPLYYGRTGIKQVNIESNLK